MYTFAALYFASRVKRLFSKHMNQTVSSRHGLEKPQLKNNLSTPLCILGTHVKLNKTL